MRGPDVASYQHPDGASIDWSAVRAGGAAFALVKATESTSYVNPFFAADWTAVRRAGLVRGAYHFARPGDGAAALQAHRFVAVIGTTRELGTFAPVLDLEDDGGLDPAALARWTRSFLDTLEQLTGRVPMLYTSPSFWHRALADDTTFGAYPLWVASYRHDAPAPLPGWSQWTLWQHTDAASVRGIDRAVDESYLCCGAGTLAALADGRSDPIAALWRRLGGASGVLGLPTGPEVAVPGGWGQIFQHGEITQSQRFGAHAVTGVFWDCWRALGGPAGVLGIPTGDQRGGAAAAEQLFSGGRIVSAPQTGTHGLRGELLGRWLATGGWRSPLGLPTGEQRGFPAGVAQQFLRAGLYDGRNGAAAGVHTVPAAIRDQYEQLGGPGSALGLPVSDAEPIPLGERVQFEVGVLVSRDQPPARQVADQTRWALLQRP